MLDEDDECVEGEFCVLKALKRQLEVKYRL